MKKLFFGLTLITSTLLLWSFIAARNAKSQFIEPDSVFVKVAASSSMLETELGNMAMQKASHQRVKDFAAMMVQEHTQATQELSSLAASKNYMLPTTMLRQHSRHMDYLRDATGQEFDRMYMRVMVDEHREDVDEFEDAAKKAKDPDVKAWAAKMLPRLQMHLDTARSLRSFVRNNYMDDMVMNNNNNVSDTTQQANVHNAQHQMDTSVTTRRDTTAKAMTRKTGAKPANTKKMKDKKSGGNQ